MAAKSLFTTEQEALRRKSFERDSSENYINTKGIVIEVLSSYKQLDDTEHKDFYIKKLEKEFIINSGVYFIILANTKNGDKYILCESPLNEDALRSLYGSDGNIKGKRINIKALGYSRYALENAMISFDNSSASNVEDNDKYISLSVAGMFGSKQDVDLKLKAFQRNKSSGKGEVYGL